VQVRMLQLLGMM